MTPRTLKSRVNELIESLTFTGFQYARRGLFERHKIIVAGMLTMRILLRSEELKPEEVDHLIIGKVDPMPVPMPDVLKSFLNDSIWSACRALDQIHSFANFTSSLETEYLQWKKWYQEEKAELADLPKAFKDCSKFHRLLLLRAMRPDRLTSALSNFVTEKMGERYIEQSPFNIFEAFTESSA
jgi:dynein heavy chain